MPSPLPGGPYRNVDIGNDGVIAPWYIVPFDRDGVCTAPMTRASVLKEVDTGAYTHVFLFSHSWNNDWEVASHRYDEFINGYMNMRRERQLPAPAGYRLLLLGIFWPSTALVLPSEQPPRFAGAAPDRRRDVAVAQEARELEEVAAAVAPADRERFYALGRKQAPLTRAEALELATLVAPIYAGAREADTEAAPASSSSVDPDELVNTWIAAGRQQAQGTAPVDDDGYYRQPGTAAVAAAPASAGLPDALDPRRILRVLTVYQMKDRAAVVGARGVGPLLGEILQRKPATTQVHLIGHSYGGKVVLSAVRSLDEGIPYVRSMLLLEPAVSAWCFAQDVNNRGYPGGYRPVLARVELPILTTFSTHDVPLTKVFHLAVRRADDLGELKVAAGARPTPPSAYAALGGFGPAGLSDAECRFVPIKAVGDRYDLGIASEVIALNGDTAISAHGAISVPATWWALYNLVA